MKTLLLSTAIAAGLGFAVAAPASAAPITRATVVAPATTDVACRTIEKRRSVNGVTKITRTRECDDDMYERRSYRDGYTRERYVDRSYDRGYDRDYRRPGVSIQLGR